MAVYKREGARGVALSCATSLSRAIKGVRTLREAKAAEAKLRAEAEPRINASGNLVKMNLKHAMERDAAERLSGARGTRLLDLVVAGLQKRIGA